MVSRAEYGRIHHQLSGKGSREDCRQGWERWQKIWTADQVALVLHPHGAAPPQPHESDYWIFASTGPLKFVARANAALLPDLAKTWTDFAQDPAVAELLRTCGQNLRARARGFVHNNLVDGLIMDEGLGPATAAAITWLFSTNDSLPIRLGDYHLFGYDISHISGPPGQKAMFNFRAVFHASADTADGALDLARAMPLPDWQPPPH